MRLRHYCGTSAHYLSVYVFPPVPWQVPLWVLVRRQCGTMHQTGFTFPFRAAQEPWQAPTAALGWEATRYPALAERAPHISDGAGPGPHLDANHGHVGVHAAAQVGQNSQRLSVNDARGT